MLNHVLIIIISISILSLYNISMTSMTLVLNISKSVN